MKHETTAMKKRKILEIEKYLRKQTKQNRIMSVPTQSKCDMEQPNCNITLKGKDQKNLKYGAVNVIERLCGMNF